MTTRTALKDLLCQAIDRRADELIRAAQTVLEHPEPGFREVKTSRLVVEWFQGLGIAHQSGIAITGVKGMLQGMAGEGPTVAILGELDSLIVPNHPKADRQTGAAHACGHHAQIGMLLGVAVGLLTPRVLEALSGRVALLAVPAEEYIEIEGRDELRRQGKIELLGGKPEFIRLGAFDDVDMALMTHTSAEPQGKLMLSTTNNGTIAKRIKFIGKAAHAGGAPHRGINALNAAMLALEAVHMQRETFRDEDTIRVHPIITKGGDVVNAVPADVRMETFVRGKTLEAILDANAKVDRALRAGAMGVGANVQITTLPGYLPLINDPALAEAYRAHAEALVGSDQVRELGHRTSSTDMGDVCHLMPAIHPYVTGCTGSAHSDDYLVEDYGLAVLAAAKAMAMTVVDLLADGAGTARRIKEQHKPALSKKEYLRLMRGLLQETTYVEGRRTEGNTPVTTPGVGA
jgi:amidohydrolase